MIDDQKKSEDNRTEFNFSGSDAADIFTAPPSSTAPSEGNWMGTNKRKLILLAGGLIVIVLAIFKLSEWFLTPSVKQPPVQTVSAPLTQASPKAAISEQENTRLNLVEGRFQENSAQLDQIQKKIIQLEANFTDMQTQLVTMNQLIQVLSQQLQQKQQVVPEQKKDIAPKKAAELSSYHIQAMVPGRAWLVNQKGAVTTVGVGDEVPGYGVISVLDLAQGTVTTDQGQIIRYHPDDR